MIKNIFLNFINKNKQKKKIENIYEKKFKKKNVRGIFTHKNDTFVVYDKNKKIFRKFSLNENGKMKIKNDYEGLKWYCLRNKIKLKKIISNLGVENNLTYLDTFSIDGKKVKFWHPLSKNYDYIKRSLDHYFKIFSNSEKNQSKINKSHGDLTLENIIFNKNKIFFIDWEFFNKNKKTWGYDAAYLVLSSITAPYLVNNNFSAKDKNLFLKLWKILIKKSIDSKLTQNPFEYFIKSIKTDKLLNRSSRISKKKFFPLVTPLSFQREIKQLINKGCP